MEIEYELEYISIKDMHDFGSCKKCSVWMWIYTIEFNLILDIMHLMNIQNPVIVIQIYCERVADTDQNRNE